MAYNDLPGDDRTRHPGGWTGSTADRDVRRGRHRARHADAAPDAYGDTASDDRSYDESSYGYAYGDGVSAHPLYGGPAVSSTGPGRPGAEPTWRTVPGAPPPVPLNGKGSSGPDRPRPAAADGPDRTQEIAAVTEPAADAGEPVEILPEPEPHVLEIEAPIPLILNVEELPPEKTSRAGRNLPVAIGVGALLAGVVIGSLFLWRPAFVAVLGATACVGVWEMVQAYSAPRRVVPVDPSAPPEGAAPAGPATSRGLAATAVRPSEARTDARADAPSDAGADDQATAGRVLGPRAEPPLIPLLGGCAAMAVLAYFGGIESLSLGLLITVLAVTVWRLSDGPAGFARDVAAATLIAAYVPFLLFFGILLAVAHDGEWRVFSVLAMIVLSDTGGYAAGVFFGKHTMAPSISPKKSWEGLVGSLAATGIGGAFLVHYLLDQPYWHGIVLGIAVSAAAVVGDLAESLLKRDLGIKDMSSLLPGHGGLMDRLDSVVFAAPVAFALLAVLAPAAT